MKNKNKEQTMVLQSNHRQYKKEQLDDVDKEIIKILQKDGRSSFTNIARKFGVSEHSIRYRTQKMLNNGTMQIIAITNPLKLGFEVMATIGVRVAPGQLKTIVEEIEKIDCVTYVAVVTGRFDLLIDVVVEDHDHLLDFLTNDLGKLEGVQITETFIYLDLHKQTYQWGVR